MTHSLTLDTRMKITGLVGTAGGLTSVFVAYVFDFRYSELPDPLAFHLGASTGAAVAGFMTAGGFGRTGILGWLVALFSALAATFLGGEIGSLHAQYLTHAGTGPIAPGLGMLLMLISLATPPVLAIWVSSFVGIHIVASALRQADP